MRPKIGFLRIYFIRQCIKYELEVQAKLRAYLSDALFVFINSVNNYIFVKMPASSVLASVLYGNRKIHK